MISTTPRRSRSPELSRKNRITRTVKILLSVRVVPLKMSPSMPLAGCDGDGLAIAARGCWLGRGLNSVKDVLEGAQRPPQHREFLLQQIQALRRLCDPRGSGHGDRERDQAGTAEQNEHDQECRYRIRQPQAVGQQPHRPLQQQVQQQRQGDRHQQLDAEIEGVDDRQQRQGHQAGRPDRLRILCRARSSPGQAGSAWRRPAFPSQTPMPCSSPPGSDAALPRWSRPAVLNTGAGPRSPRPARPAGWR